ncbi:hypothetical protein VTN00DRAFT_4426 [Thermoascus crustaceus]|uniref:uncharacterized protein n=1 Tax=Thermoascus crustaceus TaxID=5088 RepID=UPI003743CFFB
MDLTNARSMELFRKLGIADSSRTKGENGGLKGAVIAQGEVDTWIVHLLLPLDIDHTTIDSNEAVCSVLGGVYARYEIQIDERLVRSTYRPNLAVARSYSGPKRHIFLAGDSARQKIAFGGYGINMGIGDAFDIGWKLAAVIKGYGKQGLLASYQQERRPVALLSVERSGVHLNVHMSLSEIIDGAAKDIDSASEKGEQLRARIHDHYQLHDNENKDLGIEMGYRYKSNIVFPESSGTEPEFDPTRFVPTTWPGWRALHVFLSDGSALSSHFGSGFSLVEFSDGTDRGAELLVEKA